VQVGGGVPDEEAIDALAAAAAEALDRDECEQRASARADRSEALQETLLGLLPLRDEDALARAAAAAAAWLAGAAQAVVRLRDAASPRFAVRAVAGADAGPERAELLALDGQAARAALRRAAAVDAAALTPHHSVSDAPALLALPLRGTGAPLGTLAVYGRRGGEEDASGFAAEERALLERLAAFLGLLLERSPGAAAGAAAPGPAPDPRSSFEACLDAELARSDAPPLAVVCCWIDDAEALRAAGCLDAALRRAGEGLRAHLRDGDVVEAAAERFRVLLFGMGEAPAERIARLARAVAEHVAKDEALNRPLRVALAFGYALHPGDGGSREALLARAAAARIRML
jgi:GGDEF domain-containing protein